MGWRGGVQEAVTKDEAVMGGVPIPRSVFLRFADEMHCQLYFPFPGDEVAAECISCHLIQLHLPSLSPLTVSSSCEGKLDSVCCDCELQGSTRVSANLCAAFERSAEGRVWPALMN